MRGGVLTGLACVVCVDESSVTVAVQELSVTGVYSSAVTSAHFWTRPRVRPLSAHSARVQSLS